VTHYLTSRGKKLARSSRKKRAQENISNDGRSTCLHVSVTTAEAVNAFTPRSDLLTISARLSYNWSKFNVSYENEDAVTDNKNHDRTLLTSPRVSSRLLASIILPRWRARLFKFNVRGEERERSGESYASRSTTATLERSTPGWLKVNDQVTPARVQQPRYRSRLMSESSKVKLRGKSGRWENFYNERERCDSTLLWI